MFLYFYIIFYIYLCYISNEIYFKRQESNTMHLERKVPKTLGERLPSAGIRWMQMKSS